MAKKKFLRTTIQLTVAFVWNTNVLNLKKIQIDSDKFAIDLPQI